MILGTQDTVEDATLTELFDSEAESKGKFKNFFQCHLLIKRSKFKGQRSRVKGQRSSQATLTEGMESVQLIS
jgi:hypothetical protein